MPQEYTIKVDTTDEGTRIDSYLSNRIPGLSRTHIQSLIKSGSILVDSKTVRTSLKLRADSIIDITVPDVQEPDILPENISVDIVYEDEDLLVVNKPKGMVVHPANGHYTGTLVNALMFHCEGSLSGINGIKRPGIVHRIDKDTSGLLVVCKNDFAHISLAKQLKEHSITRRYRAVVYGHLPDEGTIDKPIGRHPTERTKMSVSARASKNAVTHYRVLESYPGYSYIECVLETGRTHQIRVHMASIGHPILGDAVYGPSSCPYKLDGQTLHAMTLGFVHPRTEEYIEFTAPLPEYFEHLLTILRS